MCPTLKIKVLSEDGVVERFIGHPREAAAIRATFAGLWAIDDRSPITEKLVKVSSAVSFRDVPDYARSIQSAIAHPSRFVLKPQLEGGAGNFYGEQMVEKLRTMTDDERSAHILMERIQPIVAEVSFS